MVLRSVEFVTSVFDLSALPTDRRPAFVFAGRSNVGKSSLINLLTGSRHMARTSARPGKTECINYFLADKQWYLVDLPGYGYARTSKEDRTRITRLIDGFLKKSEKIFCLFILVDARLDPQPSDLSFIDTAGHLGIPLALVLTKTDKLAPSMLARNRTKLEKALLNTWEQLPPLFETSSTKKKGREDLLQFIGKSLGASPKSA